jgi:hypothetical protein
MDTEENKFNLYLTVLRFLPFKITNNLIKLFLDFDTNNSKMTITAFYADSPSELELELLDDIVTNSNAHIPTYFIDHKHRLLKYYDSNEKHDFLLFAFYEPT